LNNRPPSFQFAQLPPDFTARKPLVFSIKSGVSLLSNLTPPQSAVLVLQIAVKCLIEFSSRQIEITDGPSRKTKNWGRVKKRFISSYAAPILGRGTPGRERKGLE